jgi:hypothetical protein
MELKKIKKNVREKNYFLIIIITIYIFEIKKITYASLIVNK